MRTAHSDAHERALLPIDGSLCRFGLIDREVERFVAANGKKKWYA